jgi:hypothetical protein
MNKVIFCLLFLLVANVCLAQNNVADVANSFILSIKKNELAGIEKYFIPQKIAYHVLPKEAIGMSATQQNEQYILPLRSKFIALYEQIQVQIEEENISIKSLELRSYKLSKAKDPNKPEPLAMSLFIDYKGKECVIPISVIEIDEQWYILEILSTSNLFKS